jgi:hypothetical protein
MVLFRQLNARSTRRETAPYQGRGVSDGVAMCSAIAGATPHCGILKAQFSALRAAQPDRVNPSGSRQEMIVGDLRHMRLGLAVAG